MDIVVGGYAETKIQLRSGKSAYALAGEAFETLLENTGLEKGEIDGLSVTMPLSEGSNTFFPVYMTDALGMTPRWLIGNAVGGCSALSGIAQAASAIRDGRCRLAVVISADAPSTAFRTSHGAFRPEFQSPMDINTPTPTFGMLMDRYAHQNDLTTEALGKIAITQRGNALLNRNAVDTLQSPLTMANYLASKMIADPMRMLDCVMPCDGANAFLVMSRAEARARGLKKMARLVAYREITNAGATDSAHDITNNGFERIASDVFSDAAMAPSDIRSFQPYDDFTIAVLMQLEAFGFCEKGRSSAFVTQTDISLTGQLPINTGGGQISAGQPGLAGGGLNVAEAVRQIYGEGEARQLGDASVALVSGIGGVLYGRNWSVSSAMILEACA